MKNTKVNTQYTEDEVFEFLVAVINACKNGERGKDLDFTFPLCGGYAVAYINPTNLHKHASCNMCKLTLHS